MGGPRNQLSPQGKMISKRMIDLDMTQGDLAAHLGTSQATISRLIRGLSVKLDRTQLAKTLGIPYDQLVAEDPDAVSCPCCKHRFVPE